MNLEDLNTTTTSKPATNILDCLLLESIYFIILSADKAAAILLPQNKTIMEFAGHVINLKPFEKRTNLSMELQIQNLVLTELINNLIDIFHSSKAPHVDSNEIIESGQFYLIELPEILVEKFIHHKKQLQKPTNATKPIFGRVLMTKYVSKIDIEIRFVDYGYETVINQSCLYQVNKYLAKIFKLLPNSFNVKYNLHLDVVVSANATFNIEHLFEVFKLLINYEKHGKFSYSSRINCISGQTKNVRLYDPSRENLDLNRIVEMCLFVMTRPFSGSVTHCDNDYFKFDCLHESAKNANVNTELKKIFKSTKAFSHSRQKTTRLLQTGQLCLVNCGKKVKEECIALESVLILSEIEPACNDEDNNDDQIDICRAVILDQSEQEQKCIVLNVDSGKTISLSLNRVRPIRNLNNSCLLAQVIPFMLVKAKQETLTEDAKKLILNSRYYNSRVQMNIIGSWKLEMNNCDESELTKSLIVCSQNSNEASCSSSYAKFVQREEDLCKVVELLNPGINYV